MKTTDSTSNIHGAAPSAQQHSIELHIEELVLHGFAPGDRYTIGEALERDLARLMGERGVPVSLRSENATDEISGATFEVARNAKPGTTGRQIAAVVYDGLNSSR